MWYSPILNWCFEENSVEIVTLWSIARDSDKGCTSEGNQTANEKNRNMDLRALCLKKVNKIDDNSSFKYKTKYDERNKNWWKFSNQPVYDNVFSAALRLDKNDRGGGFILYIIEDISSRLV